jgi:ATP-dependent DNA helicase RecG
MTQISDQELEALNLPFDLHPISFAKISDLSRPIFEYDYLPAAFAPDVLAENGRSYEERLASCRMIVSPEETTPTVLGLLTLCKKSTKLLARRLHPVFTP